MYLITTPLAGLGKGIVRGLVAGGSLTRTGVFASREWAAFFDDTAAKLAPTITAQSSAVDYCEGRIKTLVGDILYTLFIHLAPPNETEGLTPEQVGPVVIKNLSEYVQRHLGDCPPGSDATEADKKKAVRALVDDLLKQA